MARLVDFEAVLADFEAFLVQDGRPSHGTDFLTRKLAELRAKHRIDARLPADFADPWLSGFTDGEGSFVIGAQKKGDTVYYRPSFHLGLRADDALVIAKLTAAFGGTVSARSAQGNRKPAIYWAVHAKAELEALSRYFTYFPLRAKKGNDCLIWQEAVLVYLAEGGTSPHLRELRERLDAVREYRNPLEDPEAPVTDDPLASGDPSGTPVAMDGGTPTDHSTEGAAPCPRSQPPRPSRPDRPQRVSRREVASVATTPAPPQRATATR